ncbi:Protein of unknown function [Flavobacterium indicum GPTSA100-9 = DSM 17447]|uniref:Exostosin GT47 domain-containing protein n=1 Tax=Flavobacterium indicum (strain DSM 17447 / CIP 109464 / GPTSA100-9) TaxID=1094466 RepID=H8XT84_FLAIG|nr:exostosin family protein [Flavobacterium indicum]CCG52681.1 Protein of unknown function [Flavobacterium indicum GPTSA100-9 = DSM 17447]
MIKIYTQKSYFTENNRKVLFPLFLDLVYLKDAKATHLFEVVDEIQKADIAIIPLTINYFIENKREQELNDFINSCLLNGKRVWGYTGGDRGLSYRKDITIFRLGGLQSKLDANNEILPSFVTDPYTYCLDFEFEVLNKTDKPSIGFVGNANNDFKEFLKELGINWYFNVKYLWNKSVGDYQPFYASGLTRYKLLKKIESSNKLNCNFIYRDKYRAGARTEEEIRITTYQFFENIAQNLFTICIRGAGNFSVRFYETLVMGRIPVFIATDAKLPLENFIQWDKHCVFTTKANVEKDVLAFYNSKSEAELQEIQIANRNLALNLLNKVDYFYHLAQSQK